MATEARVRLSFKPPILDPEYLRVYLETVWGIAIPDTQVCPHHSTPWRALCDAYFAVEPLVLWEGSRGFAGKTFTMGALTVCEATGLGADVNFLGGSGEQSKRAHDHLQAAWEYENAPRHLLVGEAASRTVLTTGVHINALMASSRSVRGPHPQRLRIDEVDEVDVRILDAALGQAMSRRGPYGDVRSQTLLSSTHQYPDGTMTEMKRRVKAQGFPHHVWCYRETCEPHGWLAPQEVADKRRVILAQMWEAEYELNEPSPEGRAFDTEAVKKMFRDDLSWEEPLTDGSEYATGADWARKVNLTVIATLKKSEHPYRVVKVQAFNRRPWPMMVGAFNEQALAYRGTQCHDATGLGDVVQGIHEWTGDAGVVASSEPVILAGRDRYETFTRYVMAVEKGEVICPRHPLLEAEHKYCQWDDLFGGGHPPDTVVACALAYRAATGFALAWASA